MGLIACHVFISMALRPLKSSIPLELLAENPESTMIATDAETGPRVSDSAVLWMGLVMRDTRREAYAMRQPGNHPFPQTNKREATCSHIVSRASSPSLGPRHELRWVRWSMAVRRVTTQETCRLRTCTHHLLRESRSYG